MAAHLQVTTALSNIGFVHRARKPIRLLKNWAERTNFLLQDDRLSLFRADFRALAWPSWPLQRHAETPRPDLTARER